MKKQSAFTLIELLVVVAIIAIVAAIAVPNFLEAQTRSKVSRMKADLRTTAVAAEMYAVDHNYYPATFQLTYLSTPIAYVTNGQVPDVFTKSGTFGFVGYLQAKGTAELSFLTSFSVNSSTDNQRAELASHHYFILSNGPDMIDDALKSSQASFNDVVGAPTADHGFFYDPTNGTTSRGDIMRSAKMR